MEQDSLLMPPANSSIFPKSYSRSSKSEATSCEGRGGEGTKERTEKKLFVYTVKGFPSCCSMAYWHTQTFTVNSNLQNLRYYLLFFCGKKGFKVPFISRSGLKYLKSHFLALAQRKVWIFFRDFNSLGVVSGQWSFRYRYKCIRKPPWGFNFNE